MSSKRESAFADLLTRLAFITIANGYSTDAGEHIFFNETPKLGPDDAPAALAVMVGEDGNPGTQGSRIRSRVVIDVQAFALLASDATPLLVSEALIADIKHAVEIEGNDQNATAGGDASIDRFLGTVDDDSRPYGTLPRGVERGSVRALPREAGSEVVGATVEYVLYFEEGWGQP